MRLPEVVPLLCLGMLTAGLATATDAPLDPTRIAWRSLSYRASKWWLTASSEVRLSKVPTELARSRWLVPAAGLPIEPLGPEVVLVELDAQVLGKRSSLELWLEPQNGAALQRIQHETGNKIRHNRHRSLRFTDRGVYYATHRADEESVERPFSEWPLTQELEPYPQAYSEGPAVVFEPSGLFYLLAVATLERRGDHKQVLVFSKGRLLAVDVTVVARTRLEVDYLEVSSASERRVEGEREAIQVRLSGAPLAGENEGGSFEFLGLRGDVDLYLDPGDRFPLELRGHIRYAGRGRVRLQRVERVAAGESRP